MATLTLRRGDAHVIRGKVKWVAEGVSVPVNITGWYIWFTVKRRLLDTDAQKVIQYVSTGAIFIDDAPAGSFEINVAPVDFSTIPNQARTVFHYDLQVQPVAGLIQTLGDGDLVVLGDVTNSIFA